MNETPRDRGGVRLAAHAAIVVALMAAAALIWGRNVGRVGLNIDDALMGCIATHSRIAPVQIRLLGRIIPLGENDYTTAWAAYFLSAFLRFFSDKGWAVRLFGLSWACLSPALLYGMAILIGSDMPIAALCAAALPTFVPFLHLINFGFSGSGIIVMALGQAALIFLILAAERCSPLAWRLSCVSISLAVGFAIYGMGIFAGWLLCVVFLRRRLGPLWASWEAQLTSAGFLAIGPAPLIIAMIAQPGEMLRFLREHLISPQPGLSNAHYLANLGARWGGIQMLFDSSALWLSLVGAALLVLGRDAAVGLDSKSRLERLPVLCIGALLALSPFTLNSLGVYHIVFLLPLGLLAIAVAARPCPDVRRMAPFRALLCAVLVAGIARNVRGFGPYFRNIDSHQLGVSNYAWTDDAVRWLVNHRAKNVLLMDERLCPESFMFLSDDVVEPLPFLHGPRQSMRMSDGYGPIPDLLRGGQPLYFVSESHGGEESSAMRVARAYGAAKHLPLTLVQTFPDVDDGGSILIYELRS